jgi:hypothetical protein
MLPLSTATSPLEALSLFFLDNACPDVLVRVNRILVRCMQMGPSLAVLRQKSTSSKLRYIKNVAYPVSANILPRQVSGKPLKGQVSQSAQWAVNSFILYSLHTLTTSIQAYQLPIYVEEYFG